MKRVKVYVETCREGVELPQYANLFDAGMDVKAAEDIVINIRETVIVPTGLKFAIPEGYEIQVRPRSGISYKTPLRISNSPGTIDTGYRDEVGIIITNTSQEEQNHNFGTSVDSKGNIQGKYIIKKGDRIAQLVLNEVPQMQLELVESVKDIGINRNGGFGSTGV
jgi:dUTP pyrophosphatase